MQMNLEEVLDSLSSVLIPKQTFEANHSTIAFSKVKKLLRKMDETLIDINDVIFSIGGKKFCTRYTSKLKANKNINLKLKKRTFFLLMTMIYMKTHYQENPFEYYMEKYLRLHAYPILRCLVISNVIL